MSCAERGIAIIADNQKGNHLLRLDVRGPENRRIPAVAETDKINPKSIDHQGFHNSINMVTVARSGNPEAGLPLSRDNITMIAMTAARRTLG
jgi:hypothetical protein